MEEKATEDQSPEVRALEAIADALGKIEWAIERPTDRALKSMGLDLEAWQQEQRSGREARVERLYRFAVVIAGVSALASIASVIVAVLAA